jgi:polyisoprenoid-binding protein YceI
MKKSVAIAVVLLVFFAAAGLGYYKFTTTTPTEPTNTISQELEPSAQTEVSLNGEQQVDLESSLVTWEGRKPLIEGYKHEGRIFLTDGTVNFENGQVTTANFTIDMKSITSLEGVDPESKAKVIEHLMGPDFFDVEQFSTAQISITSTTPTETPGIYDVQANLTIKGVTNPITFPAQIYQLNEVAKAKATIEVDRTLWNITYGSGKFFKELGDNLIDDKFTINLDLQTTPQQA